MGQPNQGWPGLSGGDPQRVVKALFDTNILIDFLNGLPQARDELVRYDDRCISIVTWMEVMVGAEAAVSAATEYYLTSFSILPVDTNIARRAVQLRTDHRIKLPHAIIWATAQTGGMLLVTRNTKDFPSDDPAVRMPYLI
jgi:predicted nucleic acid-binding protein